MNFFFIYLDETISDVPIKEFKKNIKGLIDIYRQLNNMKKYNHYTEYLATVSARYDTFFLKLQSDIIKENFINTNLSL